MSLADDLTKLDELRRNGALNEAEFEQAKAALLSGTPVSVPPPLAQHVTEQLAEVQH